MTPVPAGACPQPACEQHGERQHRAPVRPCPHVSPPCAPRCHSASFFSSGNNCSASSGVVRSMSTSRSRSRRRSSRRDAAWKSPSCCCGSAALPLTDGRPPRASSSCSSAARISRARAMTGGGQPGQPRHLDAVAAVRPPRHDLAQEDDVVLPLAGRDVRVDDARQRVGQVGQLVVVRGEQRLRARRGVASPGTRPRPTRCSGRRRWRCRGRSRRARRGCATWRRSGCCAVSCISTMNVDCPRAMLSDAPTRAKMRSTIAELGLARRHERPGLRHQAEQRRLPQVGGLAAHVRAREDHELARRCRRGGRRWARRPRPPWRSTTGCRPSVTISSSPSCTCGLV